MRLVVLALTVVAVVTGPRLALAQDASAGAVNVTAEDAARPPGFATLDRGDASSRFGIEASYLFIGNTGTSGVTALRFEAHGQYVDAASGFGGYAQFPLGYLSGSTGGTSSSSTGVGDVEVGGLFVPKFIGHGFAIVFRVGVTLPTGSKSLSDLVANGYAALTRVADTYLIVPDGTSLRFSGSGLWRYRLFFARADLGDDVNLSANTGTTVGDYVRVNVGAGVALGSVSLTAESANTYNTGTSTAASSWYDTGALAARFRSGPADFYAAVVLPLNNATHQPLGAVATYDAAITIGVEGRL